MKKLNEIQQELKANKGQYNSFGGYNYRSCEDILEAVKPLLGEATLTITDEIVMLGVPATGVQKTTEKNGTVHEDEIDIGSRFYVKATATIKCGDESETATAYAREPYNKKGMDEAQITGATSSYARKYALNGLFCIDDAKDSDSTNTHGKEPEPGTEDKKMYEALSKAEGVNKTVKELKSFLAENGYDTPQKVRAKGKEAILKLLRGEQ